MRASFLELGMGWPGKLETCRHEKNDRYDLREVRAHPFLHNKLNTAIRTARPLVT